VFNLNKNNLIQLAVAVSLLIFLSLSVTALSKPVLNVSKEPLSVISLLSRELSGIFFYHRNLTENISLRNEVDFLRSKVNGLNEIYLENARLKSSLSFKQNSKLKFISSRVIARPADNWSSGLIIDKGATSGIKKGMVVVTFLGLAGRIVDTSALTSKVMLLCDPNLGVSSLIQRSRQEGLVCGTLGNNLIMKYLPEDADIKLQDVIVSSGLNYTYPKGLLIGKVIDIGKEFSGLSLYAIVKPAVNLSNIEEVLVIIQ